MFAVLVLIHLLISAALVIVILLQSGKGGGLAGAFGGGGGSQTIFGGRGAATFLNKSTAILGAAFMVSALTLAMVSTRSPVKTEKSVIDDVIRREQPAETRTQTGAPAQIPAAGQTQQAPGQTQPQTGAQTGQKAAPGAGVVPTQTQDQPASQPPATQQNPSQTDAKTTGGK